MRLLILWTTAISILCILVAGANISVAAQKKEATAKMSAPKQRNEMRKLLTDYIIWTRVYMIAAVAKGEDKPAAIDRLLKNQDDIGNAVVHFYGKQQAGKLTELLKDHVLQAADLIDAANEKDDAKFKGLKEKWERNAEEIAAFLSKVNPCWKKQDLCSLLKTHIDLTIKVITARVERRWDDDVKAFDCAYEHILKVSDVLSDGIIKQHPDCFTSK